MARHAYFMQFKNESKADALTRIFKAEWQNATLMSIFPYMLSKSVSNEDVVATLSMLDSDKLKRRFLYFVSVASEFDNKIKVPKYDMISMEPIMLHEDRVPSSGYVEVCLKFSRSNIAIKYQILTLENPKHHLERFAKWDRSFPIDINPYLLYMEE